MNRKSEDSLGLLDKLSTKKLLVTIAIILIMIAVLYLFVYSDSPLKLGPWRRQIEEYFNFTTRSA